MQETDVHLAAARALKIYQQLVLSSLAASRACQIPEACDYHRKSYQAFKIARDLVLSSFNKLTGDLLEDKINEALETFARRVSINRVEVSVELEAAFLTLIDTVEIGISFGFHSNTDKEMQIRQMHRSLDGMEMICEVIGRCMTISYENNIQSSRVVTTTSKEMSIEDYAKELAAKLPGAPTTPTGADITGAKL